MTHHLKINQKHFEEVLNGGKRFEVRTNDRSFKIGDRVELKEFIETRRVDTCPDIDSCLATMYDYDWEMFPACPLGRESCSAYSYDKYSGRSVWVKITHVFDISDVFNGLVAFQFEIFNHKGF